MDSQEYTVGIDEAGRGPLAGPVAVGLIKAGPDFDMQQIDGADDSKQLTENRREEWLEELERLSDHDSFAFTVIYASHSTIDEIGIVSAIEGAIADGLKALEVPPEKSNLLLDGGLAAPKRYIYQQSIKKGDAKEPIISAASIIAKVKRDKKMIAYDTQYPSYGFASHKGYPTPQHYEALEEHGPCEIHRKSYLTK